MPRSTPRFLILLLACLLAAGCAPADVGAARSTPLPVPGATPAALPTTALLAPATATSAPQPGPAAEPPAATCSEMRGRVENVKIPSQVLPRPLRAQVYLPPCFDARAARRYPLLVLLHGQGADDTQWVRLGVPQKADALIGLGLIAPLIVAMPYEQDSLGNPNESHYDQAVVEELLPYLAQELAACDRRDCRAIGGLSRGAAWSVRAALGFGQPFAALGLHSLAPFYGDYNRLPYLAREIEPEAAPAVWMDTGSRDRYLSQARHYHGLLEEYGVMHEYHLFAGEHDETYWGRVLERYLRWYGEQLGGI